MDVTSCTLLKRKDGGVVAAESTERGGKLDVRDRNRCRNRSV